MLLVERADEALKGSRCWGKHSSTYRVEFLRSQAHRKVEVQKECALKTWLEMHPVSDVAYLQQPVERQVVGDGVGEELDNVEKSEDHPVREPLSVIILRCGLDGLDPKVRMRYATVCAFLTYEM